MVKEQSLLQLEDQSLRFLFTICIVVVMIATMKRKTIAGTSTEIMETVDLKGFDSNTSRLLNIDKIL